MDRNYLESVLEYQSRRWWRKIIAHWPSAGELPRCETSIKMTSKLGIAYLDEDPAKCVVRFSVPKFWKYTDAFCARVIPHELGHIVAFRVYGDTGHGAGFRKVMQELGVPEAAGTKISMRMPTE